MKRYKVTYSSDAKQHVGAIYRYVAAMASQDIAERYLGKIADSCERLAEFSERGSIRSELRPGIRSIPVGRSATIYYSIDIDRVRILAILRRGQDPASAFEAL